jgi:nitronate monooxygenase
VQQRLCELLGIRRPILLAAMAGGPGTPELVAAVSRAGGLGVFGLSGMTVDAAVAATRTALAQSGGAPVGVNAQLAPASPATGDIERIAAALAPIRAELGLPREPLPRPPAAPALELLEATLGAGATVVTTFEDPRSAIPLARAAGAPLLAMVTTPEEALTAVAAGASGVIAQGTEAGGHRSAFLGAHVPPRIREVGTFALVPQVVDAVGPAVPVVASGGIMDARGIAAAIALGAAGVSLGTRFLVATESGVAHCYRQALALCAANGTIVTDAVTGRPARWILNRTVAALIDADAGTLGWGAQGAYVADIRKAAAEQGRPDLLPMLAGQAAGLAGDPQPAAAIMESLVRERT